MSGITKFQEFLPRSLKTAFILSVSLLVLTFFPKNALGQEKTVITPDSEQQLCVDGATILHHKETGTLRQEAFGDCYSGKKQPDYYSEQLGPLLKQGYIDLNKDKSDEAKGLLKRISGFLEKRHCFPKTVSEVEEKDEEKK